jgi:hypothetical protein
MVEKYKSVNCHKFNKPNIDNDNNIHLVFWPIFLSTNDIFKMLNLFYFLV